MMLELVAIIKVMFEDLQCVKWQIFVVFHAVLFSESPKKVV